MVEPSLIRVDADEVFMPSTFRERGKEKKIERERERERERESK